MNTRRVTGGTLVGSLLLSAAVALASGCGSGDADDDDGAAGSAGVGGSAVAGTGGTSAGGTGGLPQGGSSGSPPETPNAYDADHDGLRYVGRVDFSDAKAPRFSAPGVYVSTTFEGTAVTVRLKDQLRYGRRNYFDVIVDADKVADDGTSLARVAKIVPRANVTDYPAVWDLEPGTHTVTFVKRTESSIGYVDFLGFAFDGEIGAAPPEKSRKIQIIGDSINCGVGDDLLPQGQRPPGVTFESMCAEDNWGVPYHDAHKAFGAVSARMLDADYQIAAVSGIGLIRNYSSNPVDDLRPLPEVYDSLFLEDEESPEWDPKDFVPDAVLIALGTNDFSPGDDYQNDMFDEDARAKMDIDDYVDAYVEFVDKLRSDDYYPDAEIFLVGSPMLGDDYPPGYTSRSDFQAALAAVEAHYVNDGVENVHTVGVHRTTGTGCGTHPSAREHLDVARDDVVPVVREVMGW